MNYRKKNHVFIFIEIFPIVIEENTRDTASIK